MASYNWSNVTDFSQVPQIANDNSGGTFWGGILYGLWFILLLSLSLWGWEVALMVSSFLAMILGISLLYAGLVSWQYVLTFPGIILLMFLYLVWIQPKIKQ